MLLNELGAYFASVLPLSVSSLTRSGSVATATTSTAHGFATGETHTIAGATDPAYNGAVTVTVTGDTTFTYAVAGAPATPASGTITCTRKVFLGISPATPDEAVWLLEYGGIADEPNLGSGGTATRIEFPRVQMGFRGAPHDYQTPRSLAESARIGAMAVVNETLSGVAYQELAVLQPPFFLERDETNRVVIVMNLQAMKDPSA